MDRLTQTSDMLCCSSRLPRSSAVVRRMYGLERSLNLHSLAEVDGILVRFVMAYVVVSLLDRNSSFLLPPVSIPDRER